MVTFDAVVRARIGMVDTVGIRQLMGFVMLKSTKDRVLGVDTLGQDVPPRVLYGRACLLIMATIGRKSCSVVWGKTQNVI
jgi:ABC-type dipeptide/oligopeptide/nickel transport system permease subunit